MQDEILKGIRRRKKLKAAKMPTTNHLLVIGINKYSNGVPRLNNAVKDAKAFRNILNKQYGFAEENITELYDENAKGKSIITAFDDLQSKLGEDDNLVFYFSGHGELVEYSQRGYWLPSDAILQDRQSYLNNVEVQDLMRSCRAKHILGIIDACYSGALLLRKTSKSRLDKYYTKTSRKIITSGAIEPVPDGLPDFHSPFAAALLSSLENNTKPYCSVNSIWEDMQDGLEYNTPASALYEPVHDTGHQGGEFYFLNTNSDKIPEQDSSEESSTSSNTTDQNRTATNATARSTSLPNDLPTIKKQLKNLITEVDGIKKVFKKLDEILHEESSLRNALILLQSRHSSLRDRILINTISTSESDVEMNRIRYSLLTYIDELEEEDLK